MDPIPIASTDNKGSCDVRPIRNPRHTSTEIVFFKHLINSELFRKASTQPDHICSSRLRFVLPTAPMPAPLVGSVGQ